ncbi:MAG TPA: hypothetical protein VNT20_12385 [Flavisolibacter sp.]|jgi:hypothetical protein|nr:hypothetical protein [Flavisolibacter sp.]
MKQQFDFSVRALVLILAFLCLQSFTTNSGGDYYKVLLNGRLVAEQYLTKPVALKALSLNAATHDDKLTVYYSHCGQVGKNRTITIRKENGKILKEWKFSDSPSQQMQVAVDEILAAASKQTSVSLYYASNEIRSGRQLIELNLSTVAMARR